MLRELANEWTTKWMTEGRAAVVSRHAARKLYPETAARLAAITDPERTGEVGRRPLECESGEEQPDRVEHPCESSPTGDDAPPG